MYGTRFTELKQWAKERSMICAMLHNTYALPPKTITDNYGSLEKRSCSPRWLGAEPTMFQITSAAAQKKIKHSRRRPETWLYHKPITNCILFSLTAPLWSRIISPMPFLFYLVFALSVCLLACSCSCPASSVWRVWPVPKLLFGSISFVISYP